MKRLLMLTALAASAAAYAGPGAHGPNGEHLDAPAQTLVVADRLARLPDGSVSMPMLAQRRLGIRTVLARQSAVAATVELPGRVLMDPNAGGRVQTVVGGKVQPGPAGLPVSGQRVRKGEVLGEVVYSASPLEVANQRAQLAQLKSDRRLAGQRVQRLESLEGTVARKDIDTARAELESLAAREKALSAGLGATEPLTAPISGVIARADIVAGQVVEPRDVLFEVIDPTRVLVEASASDVALGARVGSASLEGVPGVTLEFLGAARALRDGVLPLTFRASGTDALPLAIGQPVTVVATLNEKVEGVVLPAQAITRSGANEPVVWVKASAERYVPQPVQVRPLDATTVVVTQGLAAGSRAVVQGAPLLAQVR
ncbi:MAG: efflux RND transporter periplasmic adaptor subunit [Burkholderiaceae bacterium]|nr:efflux RND transporter periplasmic adaptor subunit [Burkholderiaceae bacterium]